MYQFLIFFFFAGDVSNYCIWLQVRWVVKLKKPINQWYVQVIHSVRKKVSKNIYSFKINTIYDIIF